MAFAASSFSGSRAFAQRAGVARGLTARGAMGAVMMKKGIHPEWYPEAKVVCAGVEVMTVGGTQNTYNVDVYSGNHPFYQGATSMIITEDGQMNKFAKKFEGLGELGEVPVLAGGPAIIEDTKKGGAKGGKGGKKSKR